MQRVLYRGFSYSHVQANMWFIIQERVDRSESQERKVEIRKGKTAMRFRAKRQALKDGRGERI